MFLMPSPPRPISREWRLALVKTAAGLLAIGLSAAFLFLIAGMISRDVEKTRALVRLGARSQAEIVSSRYHAKSRKSTVKYDYVVEGRRYSGDGILDGSIRPGSKPEIAYEPRDPAQSILIAQWEDHRTNSQIALVVIRILDLTVVIAGVAYALQQRRRLTLWLNGVEQRVPLTSGTEERWSYRYRVDQVVHTSGARSEAPLQVEGRVSILYDPRRPSSSMPVTGAMLPRSVVERLTLSGAPMLPMTPRPDHELWQTRRKPTLFVFFFVLSLILGCGMVVAGVPVAAPCVPAIAAVALFLSGLKLKCFARFIRRFGAERRAVVTGYGPRQKDGSRSLRYRYVVDGIEHQGFRVLASGRRPLTEAGSCGLVVVLVDPDDARRSVPVLSDEA